MLIPIALNQTSSGSAQICSASGDIEELTLKTLGLTENALEDFVRKNIEVLFSDDESLLVVGRQARNTEGGRADLVAVDGEGNVVLIELKRDMDDIVARSEPFEFQAIRYAANYAKIATPEELVQLLFAPYIERHKADFTLEGRTPTEEANRRLAGFLGRNNAEQAFNRKQRIVLIASGFDPQTLSACAWLAKNGVDIRCVEAVPTRFGEQLFLQMETIIPPPMLEDYFVEIAASGVRARRPTSGETKITRETLPRLPKLFEWGILRTNDRLYIRGREDDEHAVVVDAQHVSYRGRKMKYIDWGREVTEWSAINIYEWAVLERAGKTLFDLRREKMAQLEQEALASSQEELLELHTGEPQMRRISSTASP